MLRQTLIEADSLFNKFDFETVVVYPSSSEHCCISCKTSDDLVYAFVEDKGEEYTTKMFGLRNWSSIHTIISSFYNKDDESSLKIDIDTDDGGSPKVFNISSGRLKMKYFLQNYSFIVNQQDLKDKFDQRKFGLQHTLESNAGELTEDIVKDICRLSSLTNEKYFRITFKDGNNYIYFGDENQSVDNGSINIGNIGGTNIWKENTYFSVDYFSALFRSMYKDTIKVKFLPERILMASENDNAYRVGALRGKAI
jgi:hypothetical protein